MWRRALFVLLAACGGGETAPAGGDGGTEAADAAPPADQAIPLCQGFAPQPLDSVWTVNGRDLRAHVPASVDGTSAVPLVLVFHGLAMNAQQMEGVSGFSAKADAEGFVVIYPEGSGFPQSWNGGDCCAPADSNGTDDVAHVAAIIDHAQTQVCIDPHRVYATGFSNGGFLSHRLGCELSDRIAAIAPVSGVMGIDACGPLRPVPVMHFHGTADGIVPYAGGGFTGYRSVDETIAGWATRDACTGDPAESYRNGMVTCLTRSTCQDGVEVTLCSVEGGGHQWPGGTSIPGGGTTTMDISATDAMWEFFTRYALP
jgi:polyhydroxybutyrate depolymerase